MSFDIVNLTKRYENGYLAINDLSLHIEKVGMVAFVGASGAGKTTLLNLLSMNDDITSGKIEFDGVCYSKENRAKIMANFAYIYQDFKLIENLTVEENLSLAIELSGESVKSEDIRQVLEQVGLIDYANAKVLNLSAGQKQRVAIARSIVRKPKVLFADEPTGNLDSENSDNILELLKKLSQNMLVLIVTHDTERVKNYADRVVKINDGKIESDLVLKKDIENKNLAKSQCKIENKKSKLSTKNTLKLTKSLNSSMKIRQIVFSVVIMLLIAVLVPLSSWSFITYEKSVLGVLNTEANTKGMFVEADISAFTETLSGHSNYTKKADLTGLQEYIEKNIGSTAQVIDISGAKRISDLYQYTKRLDKNGNPISMADATAFVETQYVILSDNPAELGIKIIKGEAPKNKFEYLISSGMYDYLNAVGCVKNPDVNSDIDYIDMTGDDIIGKEIYGVKIVGVFEDNFEADSKYHKHSATMDAYGELASFGDAFKEEVDALQRQVYSNILCNSVITSTATKEYYRDTHYMESHSRGEYLKAELSKGENKQSVTFAPINDNTKMFTNGASIGQGEILLPSRIANNLALSEGDTVTLETTINIETESDFVDEAVVRKIAKKEFRVLIGKDISSVFLHENDFEFVTDSFTLDNTLIYFDANKLSEFELAGITNYINKEFDIKEYDNFHGVNYIFDYSDNVKSNYDSIKALDLIAKIALAIVAIIYLALAYNITSINISSKANELLILKSLGMTRVQFARVYGISMIVHILVEFAIGCLLGWFMLLGLDSILRAVFESLVVIIPFDAVSIAVMFGLIIVVNIISLVINLLKINDKNLRKSYQKIKQ